MHRPMRGKYLACCLAALLVSGYGQPFAGGETLPDAIQTNRGDGRQGAGGTKLKWTMYGQGYFSRRHGLFFLENGRLHVYGELTATRAQGTKSTTAAPDDLKLGKKREPYLHEIYDLVNGKWELKQKEFSQRPVQYLDFGSCDGRDEIDLERPDISVAFRPWPGTKIKIKNVTEFPQGYAAVVYSEIPREQGITYGPEDRTLQVALLERSKPDWRLVDGIEGTMQPGYFCGTRTLSATQDGAVHPVFLLFSVQGDFTVLNSYVLD